MHANTVFLLGLGLLLVVGRGFGYLVPEDGVEGKRNDAEDESLGRSDDLNRLELKEEDETLRDEDTLDPTSRSAAAAAAAASGRPWYKSAAGAGAASRSSAAAAGAASRSSAAAAAAAARMNNAKRVGAGAGAGAGGNWDWPSSLGIGLAAAARYGMRNEENLKDNDEISRLAALKYLDDESIVRGENEIGMRSSDYEEFMKNGEDDEFIGVVRDDPSLELYYRYLSDPLRQYEEEMQSMDEAVVEEPDSFSKRILETLRESTPQVYFRLLENVIRSDLPSPSTRGAAAAAAAASGWRSAAAAAAAAGRRRAAAAAAAAAARSAAAAAAASGWRSAARSAAAAAAAAGRRSPIAPIPTSYRLAANRSAAAAAAAAGRRSAAARSAAAAAAAASKRSAAAAAAASGWRSME